MLVGGKRVRWEWGDEVIQMQINIVKEMLSYGRGIYILILLEYFNPQLYKM